MCLLFQLRPSMERYQQAMVIIMTRRASLQQVQGSSCDFSPHTTTTILTCPAGTPQDPSYLTVPFTAPSEGPMIAKEPKRPKEPEASMFIAGSDHQLIIGMPVEHIVRSLAKCQVNSERCVCSADVCILS